MRPAPAAVVDLDQPTFPDERVEGKGEMQPDTVLTFRMSSIYKTGLARGLCWGHAATQPSLGRELQQPGLYEILGIAYSGKGRISGVDVSTDDGAS